MKAVYGVRDDESVWISIGDPKTGPHYQFDLMDEAEAKLICGAFKRVESLERALEKLWKEYAIGPAARAFIYDVNAGLVSGLGAKEPPAPTDECAMCGTDVSGCFVGGHNDNKFCRYCYYPTVDEAAAKGKPGWHPHKAGERYGGWGRNTGDSAKVTA